jgi:hypothetical protein
MTVMKGESADDLHWNRVLAQRTPRSFASQRESLLLHLIDGRAGLYPPAQLGSAIKQPAGR